MIDDLNNDPLLRELATLPTLTPDRVRDRRMVARCHAVIARQVAARARAERTRTALATVVDLFIATAVVLYAALAVGEALRLTAMR
jgi:hypothetical protein